MPRIVGVLVVGFMILIGVGLLIPYLLQLRSMGDRVVCQDHFRQISFGIFNSSPPGVPRAGEEVVAYPAGTIRSPLPPDERLAWTVLLLNTLGQESNNPRGRPKVNPLSKAMDHLRLNEGWRSAENQLAGQVRVKYLLCPAGVPEIASGEQQPTQYIGIAGLGNDVAKRSLFDAGKDAGAFRYDEPTPTDAFADGLSNTVAVSETNFEIGPWLAGGPPTVRGIDPSVNRYFGVGAPLGGFHVGGTNVGMADGSVRFISEKINPAIFRAMTTIAGGETEFQE